MTDMQKNRQVRGASSPANRKNQEAELMGEMLFGSISGIPQTEFDSEPAVATPLASQPSTTETYVNLGQRMASPESRSWSQEEENARNGHVNAAVANVTENHPKNASSLEDFPELASMKNYAATSENREAEKEGFIAMEKVVVEQRTYVADAPASVLPQAETFAEPSPAAESTEPVVAEKVGNAGRMDFSSATLTSSIFSAAREESMKDIFHKYAMQITAIGASLLIIFVAVLIVQMRESEDTPTTATVAPVSVEAVAATPANVPPPVHPQWESSAPSSETGHVNVVVADADTYETFPYFDPHLLHSEGFTDASISAPVGNMSREEFPSSIAATQNWNDDSYPQFDMEAMAIAPPAGGYGAVPEMPRTGYSPSDELPQYDPALGGVVAEPSHFGGHYAPTIPMEAETSYPSFESYEDQVAQKVRGTGHVAENRELVSSGPRKLPPPPTRGGHANAQDMEMNGPVYTPLDIPSPAPMSVANVAPSFGTGIARQNGSLQMEAPPATHGNQNPGRGTPATDNYIGRW